MPDDRKLSILTNYLRMFGKEQIMSEEKSHECSGNPVLIFACSGAADVGEISDKAARTITQEGIGKMFCLAGILRHQPRYWCYH